jgi:predicted negative regulator of RcsB-dependent stress response
MLTVPGLTLLFLGVVVGLGTAFVWMFWEVEHMSKSQRDSDRVGQADGAFSSGRSGSARKEE